jgi:hypothetical protein
MAEEEQEDAGGPSIGELAGLLEQAEPGKMIAGRFTVYKTGDGGMHVAYRMEGAEEDGHLPIPGSIIKLALSAAGGRGPMGMLARMMT